MIKNVLRYLIVVFLLILLIVMLSNKNDKKQPKEETVVDNRDTKVEEPYVDNNPIQVGMYINHTQMKSLAKNCYSNMISLTDIISFEVYYTNLSSIHGTQKDLWNQYYEKYNDIDNYRIGYHIHFKTKELEVDKNILRPSDVNEFFSYVQIYLYDDIHQNSYPYNHIEDSEYTSETIFTSIKLTASTKIDEVEEIEITVFTYGNDDFDIEGNYRGNSKFTTLVQRGDKLFCEEN